MSEISGTQAAQRLQYMELNSPISDIFTSSQGLQLRTTTHHLFSKLNNRTTTLSSDVNMPTRQTKYAMRASKGFSYLVPVTVQETLGKLLKKLPLAAQSIYRECYGDIMASRACAPDSSRYMTEFVTDSFPNITLYHNRLAKLMNSEISLDEHVGYVPTLFPVVGHGLDDLVESEEVVEAPKTKKPRALTPIGAINARQKTIHVSEIVSSARPTSEGGSGEKPHTPKVKKRRATTPPNAYNVQRKTIKVSHLMSPATWSSPKPTPTGVQGEHEYVDHSVPAGGLDNATDVYQMGIEAYQSSPK